jgi:hypothetical protein
VSDVFYLRPIDPPISPRDIPNMVKMSGGCFAMHRVDWKHSFLAADGRRMLCWYGAPDAESARIALRKLGSDINAVWAGTVTGDDPDAPAVLEANFVAEILLGEPLPEARLSSAAVAFDGRGAGLVRGFVSIGGTRFVGAFRATDAAAVRAALERAGMSAEAVWACTPVTPPAP